MPAPAPRDPSAGSARLAALAILFAGGAVAGLALCPGPALADGHPAWHAAAAPSASAPVLRVLEDDGSAADDGSGDTTDDPSAADDPSADDATADDGSGATLDDDGAADDDSADDGTSDDDTAADEPVAAVVVDRRGRVLGAPRTFAPSKTARAGRVRWSGWSSATATGRGRITVKRHGHHRGVRGTGTVALTRLKVCPDGTPVYRRAVFTIARRTVATVALPGCSALR